MSILATVAAACFSISGTHITAGDLAKALPSFVPVDPTAAVAWAPLPGVIRVFHPSELERLMAPLGPAATAPQSDVCFEHPVARLSEPAVLDAMRRAVGTESKIEIVEISHFPVPAGEIVFSRESLESTPLALWRGFVRYDDDRKFPIWARVRVRVPISRIVAIQALQQGNAIRSSQVRLETIDCTLSAHATPLAIENVEGWIPRRMIPADSPVWTDSIDPPLEITKGDLVTVRVHSGLAEFTFEVEAATSGRRGDFVSLKNPDSGKIFRARVDGIKTALVQTGQAQQ